MRKVNMRGPMDDTIIPIRIRPDVVVRVQGLPFDLTEAEASKVAGVAMALTNVIKAPENNDSVRRTHCPRHTAPLRTLKQPWRRWRA